MPEDLSQTALPLRVDHPGNEPTVAGLPRLRQMVRRYAEDRDMVSELIQERRQAERPR